MVGGVIDVGWWGRQSDLSAFPASHTEQCKVPFTRRFSTRMTAAFQDAGYMVVTGLVIPKLLSHNKDLLDQVGGASPGKIRRR